MGAASSDDSCSGILKTKWLGPRQYLAYPPYDLEPSLNYRAMSVRFARASYWEMIHLVVVGVGFAGLHAVVLLVVVAVPALRSQAPSNQSANMKTWSRRGRPTTRSALRLLRDRQLCMGVSVPTTMIVERRYTHLMPPSALDPTRTAVPTISCPTTHG